MDPSHEKLPFRFRCGARRSFRAVLVLLPAGRPAYRCRLV
jgi:hypothetical protein